MPIIINKVNTASKPRAAKQELRPPAGVAARRERKTRYHLLRKDRTHEDYKGIRLFVDGEEKTLSDSSKFILEQLIKNEEI
jgi:hypothetical protein